MAGWFLDVFVGWVITLYRIAARSMLARETKEWRAISAVISSATFQGEAYMPRPVALIAYTYRHEDGSYLGVDEKPFFFRSSAKAYADQFKRGDPLIIRVKPGEPETSFVLDLDQTRISAPPSTSVST
jgi:hypothetical protein